MVYNPTKFVNSICQSFGYVFGGKLIKGKTLITGDFNIDWAGDSLLKDNFETLMALNDFHQKITKFCVFVTNLAPRMTYCFQTMIGCRTMLM